MSTTSGGSKDKMWKKGRERESVRRERGGSPQAKAKSSNVDLSEPIMARRMCR